MMPWNTFVRSALFAALAAALWLPWAVLTGPLLGWWPARATYLIVVTAVYTGGLAGRHARALPVAVVVAVAGSVAALLVASTAELAIALSVLLALARSRVLYRAQPMRTLVIEATLISAGLLFVRSLGGFTLVSTALALWGFLLVQSCFFLIGGVRERPLVGGVADPFEEAHRRAQALLDRSAV
jgi:hypothetical protein